ncbi:MAG: hypothetical protein AAGF81_18865 [Pseudomonadota bacterium]
MQTARMTGLQIIGRAVVDVARNYRTALRISVPWAVPVVIFYAVQALIPTASLDLMMLRLPFWIAGLLGVMAYVMVSMTAIAIAWHRFILKDEVPNSLFPISSTWQIGRYIFTALGITWTLCLTMVPFLFLALALFRKTSMVSTNGEINWFLAVYYLVSVITISFMFFRLCVMLPAVALQDRKPYTKAKSNPYTFDWAWDATQPFSSQLFLISAFTALITFAFQYTVSFVLPQYAVLTGAEMLYVGLAAAAVCNWCWFMLHLSLLTTLYDFVFQKDDQSSGSSRSV